ncbi:SDR family oxidoreductase [Skermania piniformis]|uniref:SDR family oxidoreductase n=1 Tax=Skermania pinensis TaxID=39122 RepID=A0ABX8SAI3_9ACTN|nr:SDR family oxidoreductase [Skermania piniformis]QXQ13485.1 SDR family oxidoreductase [Skermania piniformis]
MALLTDKTLVVAGVGPGLGREVALAAHREGGRVVLGARTEANLRAVAGELDRVTYQVTEITDGESCRRLVAAGTQAFGSVDALVVVAARDTDFGGIVDADLDTWRAALEVNLLGSMRLVQAAVPELARRGGSIVLIGTQAMFAPSLPQTAYAASKGALHAAMLSLAKELGPQAIRVNTVVPTWMWGPNVEAYVQFQAERKGVEPAEVQAGIARRMALREIPEDGDVANAVIFFASELSRMVTGQTLFVNAGEYFR